MQEYQYNYCFHDYLLPPGILAGLWPYGVISFVRELFLSKSKSQVYGHLHQFLQSQLATASRLSKSQALYHLCYYMCVYSTYSTGVLNRIICHIGPTSLQYKFLFAMGMWE